MTYPIPQTSFLPWTFFAISYGAQHCSSCCSFNTITYEGFWDTLQQDKLSKIKRTLIPLDFFFHTYINFPSIIDILPSSKLSRTTHLLGNLKLRQYVAARCHDRHSTENYISRDYVRQA